MTDSVLIGRDRRRLFYSRWSFFWNWPPCLWPTLPRNVCTGLPYASSWLRSCCPIPLTSVQCPSFLKNASIDLYWEMRNLWGFRLGNLKIRSCSSCRNGSQYVVKQWIYALLVCDSDVGIRLLLFCTCNSHIDSTDFSCRRTSCWSLDYNCFWQSRFLRYGCISYCICGVWLCSTLSCSN